MSDKGPNFIESPIRLNIDYDATNLIDGTVTKAAGAATDTLTSLWYITAGWFDYCAAKAKIKRIANLKIYQASVNKEISKIPIDQLVEPRISILGPAIQSSEFYFEEEHYSAMFAKLIASSMDSTKQNTAHTSFVEIIKQMSSTDAILFEALSRNRDTNIGTHAIVKVVVATGENIKLIRKLKNLLVISGSFGDFDNNAISMSLNNLNRLGLVDISFTATFSDKKGYSFIDRNPMVVEYRSDPSNPELQIEKGILELTTFGYSFASVCL